MIFDGKAFSAEMELALKKEGKLVGKRLLIIGDEGNMYVRLKKEMGERLGVEVRVKSQELRIKKLEDFDGVIIQLPVKDMSILKQIPVEKDVDGLNEKSGFLPAAVRAVEHILDFTYNILDLRGARIAVVGARGMVGRRVVKQFQITGFDKGDDLQKLIDFDVVISATGAAGLITENMVKEGVVAIDLGFPKGDFDKKVEGKAVFFTPVPGGVGPVTIACLYENLQRV